MGVTHGTNGLADALRVPLDFGGLRPHPPLVELADEAAGPPLSELFCEIREFYGMGRTPNLYRALASNPGQAAAIWRTVRTAFEIGPLEVRTKVVIMLAASAAARSDYGLDLYWAWGDRLGLGREVLLETIHVVGLYDMNTKIADFLQLEEDFSHLLGVPKGD